MLFEAPMILFIAWSSVTGNQYLMPVKRAHEYTLSNMKFALSILPHDLSINDYYRKVKELRAKIK